MLIFNLAYRRFIWAILSAGPLADLGKTFAQEVETLLHLMADYVPPVVEIAPQ